MKKKLFLFACLLLTAVSGWALDAGEYLIQNVETGYFLGGGHDWGTHASLIGKPQWFGIAAGSTTGTYTLDSHQSNGGDNHYLATGLYCDALATDWTITETSTAGVYTISATINDATAYLAGNGENAVITTVTDGTATAAQWKFISTSDYAALQAAATTNNPVDVTALIKDPELKRNGNTSGYWTITGSDGTGSPSNFAQGQSGNYAECAESYHSTSGFKVVQTLNNLNKGIYTLSAQAFYRQDGSDTENIPYIFAGDKTANFNVMASGQTENMVGAYASFLTKSYTVTVDPVTVAANGSLTVGAAGANTAMWNIFGEFGLTYKPDYSELSTLITKVNAGTNEAAKTYAATFSGDLDDLTQAQIDLYYRNLTIMDSGNGTDLTSYLVNPAFDSETTTPSVGQTTISGWTQSGTESMEYQKNTAFGNGTWYVQRWHKAGTFDLNQTLTNLPAGYYVLTATASGSSSETTKLYANSVETGVSTSGDYNAMVTLESNADLKVGFKFTGTTTSWDAVDNFRLVYYLSEFDYYKISVAQPIIDANSPMNADVKTALTTAMAGSDLDALKTAVANAQASIDVYAAITTQLAKFDEAGQTAFNATEVGQTYVNRTYTDADLTSAYATAALSQTTAGADMTLGIINPSFELGVATGWTNDSGTTKLSGQTNTAFAKDGVTYAESWQPNGTHNISQAITVLQTGKYRLTAKAFARGVTSAILSVDDASIPVTIGASSADYTVEFCADANSEIKIGYTVVGTGAGSSWICVDNFRLTYVSSEFGDLPEAVDADSEYLNKDIADAQDNAIDTYENSKTAANFNAAVTAINAAWVSVAAYNEAEDALTKAKDTYNSTNVVTTAAATAFKTAIDNANTAFEDGTLTNAEALALENTLNGGSAYKPSNVPARDYVAGAWTATNSVSIYANNWSTEGDTDGSNFKAPFIEDWIADASQLADTKISATLTGITAGTYVVTADVRLVRSTSSTDDITGLSLQVNDGDAVNFANATAYNTNRFVAAMTAKGTVGEDGTLTIAFNVASTNASWLAIKNVKYVAAATDEDMTALNEAIAAAEANHTLGFLKDQYAPYKNVNALTVLDGAKSLVGGVYPQEEIQGITEALVNVPWYQNTEELDAIYDGKFANTPVGDVSTAGVKGWTTENAVNMRQVVNAEKFVGGKGLYVWSATFNYGEAIGYTMPLEANTVYKLTMNYAGWNNVVGGTPSVSVLNGEDGLAVTEMGTGAPKYTNGVMNYTTYFKTGDAAGNYVLSYIAPSGTNTVIGDLSLTRFNSVTRNTTTTVKYGTICLPYAFTAEGADIMEITNIGNDGMLELSTVDTPVAGTPYIYEATANTQTFTYASGNVVSAPVTNTYLTGVFTMTDAPVGSYVLQNHDGVVGFYKVVDTIPSVGAYRAYITTPTDTDIKAFYFDHADAIQAIEALTNGDAKIYDLNGRQLNRLQKGINIVNGHKVMVK